MRGRGGRGLRGDIKRQGYAEILDEKPVGDRGALAGAAGPTALTVWEADARDRRKVCKVFTAAADAGPDAPCERRNCGRTYEEHRLAWRAAS